MNKKQENSVFYAWVPDWFAKLVLMFCMLHTIMMLGLYNSNITYAASFLDVEAEDLQFSMSLTYGAFLATILVENRLFNYFPTRAYFLVVYAVSVLCIVLSAYTTNFGLFFILRLVEGICMALPWIPLRILLLSRFKSENATILVFSITYGILLLSSPFITNIAIWFLDNYEWSFMVYASALLQVFCIGLVLISFNTKRFYRKFPLYQTDWVGFVLVLVVLLSGAFVLVYGEKKYWFESAQIVLASILGLVSSSFFILRMYLSKRPVFDLSVLKNQQVLIGICLFLLLYIERSSLNVLHTAMAKVWNWEPLYIGHVYFINAAGNVLGLVLAAIFLKKSISTRAIFMIGFGLLSLFHLWFTFLFVPDLAVQRLAVPYFLQGVGVGVLFVPAVLFIVSSVSSALAPSAATAGLAARFWGNTLGFSILQNASVWLQKKHVDHFLPNLTVNDALAMDKINSYAYVFQQKGFTDTQAYALGLKQFQDLMWKDASLLADMEIFTVYGVFFALVFFFLLLNKQLFASYSLFRNRVWGS